MSHNITEGIDIVGSSEGTEWHGLAVSLAEARAFLDYSIAKVPLYLHGATEPFPGAFGGIRADTKVPIPNAVYGPRYTPVQNSERFALADTLTKLNPSLQITTLGSVNSGSDIFISLTHKEPVNVASKRPGAKPDLNYPFLNYLGNNTGLRSEQVGAGYTRVVCWNTYRAALSEHARRTDVISIRHTASAQDRLLEAERILSVTLPSLASTISDLQRLLSKTFDPKGGVLASYYNTIMPRPTAPTPTSDPKIDAAKQALFEKADAKVIEIRRTWKNNFLIEQDELKSDANFWLAYNSVTKWAQHSFLPRTAGKSTPMGVALFETNNFGPAHDLTLLARDTALSLSI